MLLGMYSLQPDAHFYLTIFILSCSVLVCGLFQKEKCRFNSTHLMLASELDMHVMKCEDRAGFDLYKYQIAPKETTEVNRTPVEEPEYIPLPDSEENWDNLNLAIEYVGDTYGLDSNDVFDMNLHEAVTYDPQYCKSAPVIRQLNVAPRSQRRAFKEAERIRLNQMR